MFPLPRLLRHNGLDRQAVSQSKPFSQGLCRSTHKRSWYRTLGLLCEAWPCGSWGFGTGLKVQSLELWAREVLECWKQSWMGSSGGVLKTQMPRQEQTVAIWLVEFWRGKETIENWATGHLCESRTEPGISPCHQGHVLGTRGRLVSKLMDSFAWWKKSEARLHLGSVMFTNHCCHPGLQWGKAQMGLKKTDVSTWWGKKGG